MRRGCGYIIIITVLLLGSINTAMAQSRNSLSITGDRLILKIDLQSSQKTLDSILSIAGINTVNAEKILKGDFTILDKDGWNRVNRQNSVVVFDRLLTVLNDNPQNSPYDISLQIPQLDGKPGYPAEVKYGVNRFSKITVFGLSSGLTRFILPGYTHAKRVLLSGNFNNWSTLNGLMKKADGGWILDVKLEPGVYQYKFIIGGHWSTDPNNLQTADDGAGNVNSVFYKYNYTFKLKGYAAAHRVLVAGDFNKWNADELVMDKNGDSWQREMYLADGKYRYRFLVDGNWITDPANPVTGKDDKGNLNSVIALGETIHFKLKGYSTAKKVSIAGDFNNWTPDELMLKKTQDGWALSLVLGAGNYGYKFIVDDKWINDPQNTDYVVKDEVSNSFIAVKVNHIFKLKGYTNAKTVKLSGTFINWDQNGYTLGRKGNEWAIGLYLKPGKYLYKFIVDGQWMIDPGNKLWEQNEYNNGNSVLWME